MTPPQPTFAPQNDSDDVATDATVRTGLTPTTILIVVLGFSFGLIGKAVVEQWTDRAEPAASTAAADDRPSDSSPTEQRPGFETSSVATAADVPGGDSLAPSEADSGQPVERVRREAAQVGAASPPPRRSSIDRDLLRELSALDESAPEPPKPSRRGRPVEFFEESAAEAPTTEADDVPTKPTAKHTLARWNRLNEIIDAEAAMRAAPSDGVNASNAGDFLQRRIDAGHYAAVAIRDLSPAGVDSQLIAFSERLAVWYAKGAAICEKGQHLLEKASDAERKGPEGKAWQKNDKEHQASVNGLNSDGEALRRRLAAKYSVAFPRLK